MPLYQLKLKPSLLPQAITQALSQAMYKFTCCAANFIIIYHYGLKECFTNLGGMHTNLEESQTSIKGGASQSEVLRGSARTAAFPPWDSAQALRPLGTPVNTAPCRVLPTTISFDSAAFPSPPLTIGFDTNAVYLHVIRQDACMPMFVSTEEWIFTLPLSMCHNI